DWTESRRSRARLYQSLLRDSGIRTSIGLPNRHHVYHIFGVFHPKRDTLQQHLQRHGIQTGIHYPIPVHLQKAYQHLGYHEGDLPVTELASREELSLPMFAELTDDEVQRVTNCVLSIGQETPLA